MSSAGAPDHDGRDCGRPERRASRGTGYCSDRSQRRSCRHHGLQAWCTDGCHQYLGYRLQFIAGAERYGVDVTGAASRVLPTELFPPDILRRAAGEWVQEIPPESGNVPGGFAATGRQAWCYAAARAKAPGGDLLRLDAGPMTQAGQPPVTRERQRDAAPEPELGRLRQIRAAGPDCAQPACCCCVFPGVRTRR
jgi:hypothetical protein